MITDIVFPEEFNDIKPLVIHCIEFVEKNKKECFEILKNVKNYNDFHKRYPKNKRMLFDAQFGMVKFLLEVFEEWNFGGKENEKRAQIFLDKHFCDFHNEVKKKLQVW
jgi:hypothetical protein